MARSGGMRKRKNVKKLALLAASCVAMGLIALSLCLALLSRLGIVELSFGNKTQHSAQVSGNADMGEGEISRPSQAEDPTQDTQPHTHSFVQQVVEATCTQGGYTLTVCECGESQEENPVQPLGHSYESKTTAAGTVYTCTRCEDTYTQTDSGSKTGNAQTKKGEPSLNMTDLTLSEKGQSVTLHLRYSDGEEIKNAVWTSADPTVATVKNGTVTIISAGRTTVTAAYNGKTYTCVIRGMNSVNSGPADKEDDDISVDIGKPSVPGDTAEPEDIVIDFDGLLGASGNN